jgi:ribonuclease E
MPIADVTAPPVVVASVEPAPVQVSAEPVARPAVQAAAAAPVAVVVAVPAFELPLDSLQSVAASAGLQWVNSDSDKIRAVQAAMAAEPPPAHVPRERKPVQSVDEGPLVLVETRKDLSQFKLPFDTGTGSQPRA